MGLKSFGEKRIQRAFADVGTEHGGEFYVPAPAVDRYIEACVRESLAIVGVEVFRVSGGKRMPDLDQIADFSSALTCNEGWETVVRTTAAAAHRFVEQVPTGEDVRFNLTLLSADEQRSG